MKKVLIVGIHEALGGTETFMLNYFNHVDKNKIHYDFINARGKIYFQDYFAENGAVIYDLPDERKNPVPYYKKLVKIMKDYEIVHINMLSAANILPISAAKRAGVKKIIVHSHNAGTIGIVRNMLHFIFKGYLRRNATDFFACSELAGKWMFGEKTVSQNNFHVINNGIDIEKFKYDDNIRSKIREKYGLENNFVVGHVGRFSEQKNHEFLIDIFAEVYKRNYNAKLMLVGDGELRGKIEEKVKKLGLSAAVIFCGVCDNVNEMYQAMDVFVLPSLFEGLGIVLIEAQTAGLYSFTAKGVVPIEADIGGIKFIDLECGADIWAESILKYADCQRVLCHTSDYDIKYLSKQLEQIYLE